MMKSLSKLRKMFIMVDNDFFESEVRGRTGDQLEFWSRDGDIGEGFHNGQKSYRTRTERMLVGQNLLEW